MLGPNYFRSDSPLFQIASSLRELLYVQSTAEATRAFRLFFNNECWLNQSFEEEQFAEALVHLFKTRHHLRDRLQKFEVLLADL